MPRRMTLFDHTVVLHSEEYPLDFRSLIAEAMLVRHNLVPGGRMVRVMLLTYAEGLLERCSVADLAESAMDSHYSMFHAGDVDTALALASAPRH